MTLEQATDKKRKTYDIHFKLQAIEFAKENSKEAASRRFQVNSKRIHEWCKQEGDLQLLKDHNSLKRKRIDGAGRKLTSENLERIVLNWIEDQRLLKHRVSRKMIMRKATELFNKDEFDDATRDHFKARRGWVDNFLERNNLTIRKRTTVSQKTPYQLIPKLVSFVINIRTLRLKFNYSPASIGAMDETAVWVDMLNM
jgi:transposase-like protein